MQIQKRSFPMYLFLNCLTLGVYGFIVSMQIDQEINALCKGDGERTRFSYAVAVMFRGIAPAVGLLVGLIFGLISSGGAIIILGSMLIYAIIFTLVGSTISGIYLNYWWYKQANRLKLNGWRYGLTVKESGTDTFLFRTVLDVLFLPITIILFALSALIPMIIIVLISLIGSSGTSVVAMILALIFALLLMIFGMELTTGANFGMFFIMKNLNRYADVAENGPAPFDPMGYQYYPSVESKYPNFLPNLMVGEMTGKIKEVDDINPPYDKLNPCIIGEAGSCAGYKFDLTPNDEVIVGKDAKVANIVIDQSYREISRKHLGLYYDNRRNEYCVTDYSSNGTWANGSKLVTGQPTYLPSGTELKLANSKNIFRLG